MFSERVWFRQLQRRFAAGGQVPGPSSQQIPELAYERLKAKLDYSTIAFQFMPKEFTLTELQAVYEMILGEPLDKRNFRKRILSLDVKKKNFPSRRLADRRGAMTTTAHDARGSKVACRALPRLLDDSGPIRDATALRHNYY